MRHVVAADTNPARRSGRACARVASRSRTRFLQFGSPPASHPIAWTARTRDTLGPPFAWCSRSCSLDTLRLIYFDLCRVMVLMWREAEARAPHAESESQTRSKFLHSQKKNLMIFKYFIEQFLITLSKKTTHCTMFENVENKYSWNRYSWLNIELILYN